ncbi:DoxX family protein [Prosthecomicrobium pneumaticum]|uniref:Putative oxidoreductase n=1 Tax=Prosthecomicrobium pneumaticum TaxID=81895 RepID=A0A7W9FKJ7_9HYPH|nr:DoxX family protein [Prosthecomicrobium pneumaticum]MBB5752756.1 putative oxidoreductase [Prosthecomicrobium pneumaticum]
MSHLDLAESRPRLFIPPLGRLYAGFAQPASWLALRLVVGGALALEGWPKIVAPLAQTGFVESIGFHPGWLWSPLLAAMQFFGGIAIALGLFTRPIALANAVMLAITYWFHVTHPYGDAFLTPAGIEALGAAGQTLFTPAGLARLADGGAGFLAQVQDKANMLSAIWTVATLVFAGYGGGPLSLDRLLVKREF